MDWTIEDWRWTQTPEGAAAVQRAPVDPSPADIARLRKKYSASQVRIAIELARAYAKADRKFESLVLGDRPGIEMASSTAAARYKASRFLRTLGAGAPVVDLCCGVGGDTIELAYAGLDVVGVDLDPVRAWMCEQNAGTHTLACDVLDPSVPNGAFHLDPARRTNDGKRSRDLESLQPGPDVWNTLIDQRSDGAIKLHPGVHADDLPAGELEILSESGKLTQAVLWVGRFAQTERQATLIDTGGRIVSQLAGTPARPEEETPINAFIHTMDPSVERADLVPALLAETRLGLVFPGTGLLTGPSACAHPMTTAFAVLDTMPWNQSTLKNALRAHGAGVVEVKTRGQVVDSDSVQHALRGDGDRLLTVFVLPIAGAVTAIITERTKKNTRPAAAPGGCVLDSNP
ncbi:MAG: hypothetical protein KC996_08410 [Phycisphaerales bacterium]|nr:hypothetical protein [Phycisphaerales bacterium]